MATISTIRKALDIAMRPGTLARATLAILLLTLSGGLRARRGAAAPLAVNINQTEVKMNHMAKLTNWTLRLVAAAGVMLAAGLGLGASPARAEELIFDVPAVIASVAGNGSLTQMDADFYPVPLVPKARYAFERVDYPFPGTGYVSSGSAQAAVGLTGYMAMAHVTSGQIAAAEAYLRYVVGDPQNRGEVKVTLEFKGEASSSGSRSNADWQFKLGYQVGECCFVRTSPDGTISFIETPSFNSPPLLEVHGTYRIAENNPQGGGAVVVFRNGEVVERRLADTSAKDKRSIDLTVAPGDYLLAITAGAGSGTLGGSAMAVVDPVMRPHPDNPDVVVSMSRGAVDPTPRSPLAGITAEQLAAEGLDVEGLQELGFLEPPASDDDSTPPSTIATPMPGANPNGWNKSPVTVTLTATDNTGGAGVKEIHVALSGATIGQQVVAGDTTSVAISAEGTTTLSYFAVDNAGNQETPKTLSVSIDQTPPVLAGLPAAGCTLWPPDHRLVEVGLINAQDALSGFAGAPVVTVTSNEPATGTGDGDLEPDVLITGGAVQLRAERAGHGTGRVYTITATASDLAGNTASATATCKVPHDRRQTAKP